MQSHYLSEKERKIGCRNMQQFEIFNGISYGLLGETLVYILAVRFAASNMILGFIPTAIYVTFLVIPFVAKFLNGRNYGRTMAVMWLLRGFVGIGYLGMLFTDGTLRVCILLVVYSLYALFRAVGMISYDPIAKSVTTLHNRGGFYATLNFAYNLTLLVAKLISSFVTGFMDSITVIVILQMIGVAGNTVAAYYAFRIPCRLSFGGTSVNYLKVTKDMLSYGRTRNRVMLRWIFYVVKIFMSMVTPFLSKKLFLSDGLVIMYSVVVSVAYLTGGLVSRSLSDRVGARPLLQICSVLVLATIAAFMVLPAEAGVWPLLVVGYIFNTAVQVCELQAGKLVVSAIPDNNNAASFNVVVNLGTGVVSLLAGFVSGYLVEIGELAEISGRFVFFNDYAVCYAAGFLTAFLGFVFTITLREKGAKTAIQLMSLKNLQAVSQLKALEHTTDSFYRRRQVMVLGANSSSFVYDEVHSKLHSPYSRDLHDLLQVIGEKRRSEYIPDIVNIAADDNNYVQVAAIETLSNFHNNQLARNCLENVFHSSRWVSARTAAAKSLSFFDGSERYYDELEAIESKAEHIEVCVDCIVAKYYMDSKKRIFAEIFRPDIMPKSRSFKQTRYSCFDALLINENALSRIGRIYEKFNNTSLVRPALESFLMDNRNIYLVDTMFEDLIKSVENLDIMAIVAFSNEVLRGVSSTREDVSNCIKSIESFSAVDQKCVSQTDLMALLYFSIYISSLSD